MKYRPALPQTPAARKQNTGKLTIGLWTLVTSAWIAEITADNLNASDHVLNDIRVVALAATIGALNSLIVARLDRSNELLHRAYEAMMDIRRSQPEPGVTPLRGFPALRSVGADDEPSLPREQPASPRRNGA